MRSRDCGGMIDMIIELGHESGILCLFCVKPWNACRLLFYLSSVYQYRTLVQSIIFMSRTMDVFVQRLSEMKRLAALAAS